MGVSIFARVRAYVERLVSPGFSYCQRCKRPWRFVEGHVTDYADGRGCFPLCRGCWTLLTPPERLPYYKAMWLNWQRHGSDVPWEAIRAACLHEKPPEPCRSYEEALEKLTEFGGGYSAAICAFTRSGPVYYLKPSLPDEVREAWAEYD